MVGVPGRSKGCNTCRKRKIAVGFCPSYYAVSKLERNQFAHYSETLVRSAEASMRAMCQIGSGVHGISTRANIHSESRGGPRGS